MYWNENTLRERVGEGEREMNEWMNELRRFCIFFASSNEEKYKSNRPAPNARWHILQSSHLKSANARHMENFNVIRRENSTQKYQFPFRHFSALFFWKHLNYPSLMRTAAWIKCITSNHGQRYSVDCRKISKIYFPKHVHSKFNASKLFFSLIDWWPCIGLNVSRTTNTKF